jgi:hypothetical protein
MKGGWPLAVVGSLGYILGQYPVAVYLGPYLPDVTGSIVWFMCLLLLLRVWRPKTVLGYGGVPVDAAAARETQAHGLSPGQVVQAWLPFVVLLIVVAAWTGPWSPLPKVSWFKVQEVACSSLAAACPAKGNVSAVFNFAPFVGGSAILASWIIVALLLTAMGMLKGAQIGEIFRRTWHQMWGAMLVGVFIFGLAYVFNYSGMAASLAKGFSGMGTAFIVVAPILGFIGVALSGSNTSTNAMFGKFQALVGAQLGLPPLLLPSLNSVGAEIGKPVAPQTASVGVSTSKFVRKEGDVIRHNMGWTFILLAYLIVIAVLFYFAHPRAMELREHGLPGGGTAGRLRAVTEASERVDPRQLATERELMDGLGTFVGDDALEVQHVADRREFGTDPGATEHVAAVAGDVERHATIVPLGKRDLDRLHRAGILQSPELQCQQLRGGDAPCHVGEPHLDGLIGSQRTPEQLTRRGVLEQLPEAGLRGADHTPADTVARLGETRQRPLEAHDAGEHAALGNHYVVEEQSRRHRSTERELVLDLGS